jgi:uncharacterized phage protein (predicted DNA packaging)
MDILGKKINEVDLEFTKEYLKVDYTDEDNIINALIVAAYSYIETMLGYKIKDEWPITEEIPGELTVAFLMIVAHWFDNRQFQTAGTLGVEINFAVSAIIDAHKRPLKGEYIDEDNVTHLV